MWRYIGEPDAIYRFMERLLEIEREIKEAKSKHFNKPLTMSEEDERSLVKPLNATFVVGGVRRMTE